MRWMNVGRIRSTSMFLPTFHWCFDSTTRKQISQVECSGVLYLEKLESLRPQLTRSFFSPKQTQQNYNVIFVGAAYQLIHSSYRKHLWVDTFRFCALSTTPLDGEVEKCCFISGRNEAKRHISCKKRVYFLRLGQFKLRTRHVEYVHTRAFKVSFDDVPELISRCFSTF